MRVFRAIVVAGLFLLLPHTVYAASYAALSSMDTQVAKAPDTAYPVVMVGELTAGYKADGARITIIRGGDYFVSAAAQAGGNTAGDVYLWMRVNGKDIPDSNSIQTIPVANYTAVLVATTQMTFKAGDVLELVYAATAPGLGLVAARPTGLPAVPSMIFSIFEL